MKKKKYLPLYYKWMKTEQLPERGLCRCLGDDRLFDIIKPRTAVGYWAGDPLSQLHSYTSGFNPIRQNIVLFLAAMNNEL